MKTPLIYRFKEHHHIHLTANKCRVYNSKTELINRIESKDVSTPLGSLLEQLNRAL